MSNKPEGLAAQEGVNNPSGVYISAFSALYLAGVPLTSFLTKPNGVVQRLTEGLVAAIPGGTVSSGRMIPALSAIYIFWTFGASGAISAAGQAMARPEGLDNNHPRKFINNMEGLPLRMRSAHYGLIENFPAFALAAALTQVIAPDNQVIVNLLGFHVIAKLLVYYPSYLMNIAPPRTLSHVFSIASLINVCWRLAISN